MKKQGGRQYLNRRCFTLPNGARRQVGGAQFNIAPLAIHLHPEQPGPPAARLHVKVEAVAFLMAARPSSAHGRDGQFQQLVSPSIPTPLRGWWRTSTNIRGTPDENRRRTPWV